MLGILDLGSIGYYQIKHGVWQQNLNKYFRFESADVLSKQFNKSFLSETYKKEVMDMLYKYKYAFRFRDETGTCTKIEVEIDLTDKSASFWTISC